MELLAYRACVFPALVLLDDLELFFILMVVIYVLIVFKDFHFSLSLLNWVLSNLSNFSNLIHVKWFYFSYCFFLWWLLRINTFCNIFWTFWGVFFWGGRGDCEFCFAWHWDLSLLFPYRKCTLFPNNFLNQSHWWVMPLQIYTKFP